MINPPQNFLVNTRPELLFSWSSFSWLLDSLSSLKLELFCLRCLSIRSSFKGILSGGLSLIFGSHSLGGRHVTWSRNSSNPFYLIIKYFGILKKWVLDLVWNRNPYPFFFSFDVNLITKEYFVSIFSFVCDFMENLIILLILKKRIKVENKYYFIT